MAFFYWKHKAKLELTRKKMYTANALVLWKHPVLSEKSALIKAAPDREFSKTVSLILFQTVLHNLSHNNSLALFLNKKNITYPFTQTAA